MPEANGPTWCLVKIDFNAPPLEDEFNRWYDSVHLPELLAIPGVTAAWRLRASDEGVRGNRGQRYLAVYQLEDASVWESVLQREKPMWDGLWGNYIENWDRVFYDVVFAG